MSKQPSPRADSPRDFEDSPPRDRGRSAAPRLSIWAPLALKAVLAVVAAAVLAFIGARAGARPTSAEDPSPSSISSPTPSASSAGLPAPAPPEPPPAADAGGGPAGGVLADGRIILNLASEEELTKLPGIGPSRARAILALRQRLAKFRAVEDLLRVKGIGRKTLRRIKPNVVLDRPPVPDAVKAIARE
jgi:competence protein ComEA